MLGERIKRARKASGYSLRHLADKINLSHAAVKKYEDNQTTPSSDILNKLARALNVKVEYFFRTENFTLESIQYREHMNVPQSQLGKIEAQVLEKIERRVELENLFPFNPIKKFSVGKLPEIKNEADIEIVANHIRKIWNLGLDPIMDVIDLLEMHGIKVFELDAIQHPKFEGLCALFNDIPVIMISKDRPGDRQRFTLAHELGHLILRDILPKRLDEERCCHRFAGAFLLPKEALFSAIGEHRNHLELREIHLLKQEFGISMQSILHRAEDTGIISSQLYHQLKIEFNEKNWIRKEPGLPIARERSHIFEKLLFYAFAEEYIGESKAAELLNVSIIDFRSMRVLEYQHAINYYA